MENIDINSILDRQHIFDKISSILKNFENNINDITIKRGIYIYGAPGSGKTEFITRLLQKHNYSVIKYDSIDIRNKLIIDNITKTNASRNSVISLMNSNPKPVAIIMDEIDGMNSGDKGGITALIKLMRQKKTKKQKLEELANNIIICIGSYHQDKKLKELEKISNSFELKVPTNKQVSKIIDIVMENTETTMHNNLVEFINGDLRKLSCIYNIYIKNNNILSNNILTTILSTKSLNESAKNITKNLMNNNYSLENHSTTLNENDRTIVGLIWHENIIDCFEKQALEDSIRVYSKMLDNICFADYIDRITFQYQIWQFNELSSLIKTFSCNKLYHDSFPKKNHFNPLDVRFTKVLTKYSSEYNNSRFINDLCYAVNLDKNDMFSFFIYLQNKYSNEYIIELLSSCDINKLYIKRIYRFMEKSIDEVNIDEICDLNSDILV